MNKVIIAGSRGFNDYPKLKQSCNQILKGLPNIEIVSGTARGADMLGERYAHEMCYKITQMPANWKKFGKSAGYKRNAEMAIYADYLIAFWDGKSKGTKHMIDLAKKNNIKIKIIRI